MGSHALRLSLVIPVYNEAHHIRDCLEHISRQTVMPYEVILVDNNSTDETVAIAKEFAFVKIVTESRQGRGWARSTGFDAAQGEIIGRIDADSRISRTWVERVLQRFSENNQLMGLTGLGRISLLPRTGLVRSTFWIRTYYWVVHGTFRTITMWGANMALRKSAWEAVKTEVCNDDALVHEDQDLSLCMAAQGMPIVQDNSLLITTRGQTYYYFPKLLQYWRLEHRTKARHEKRGTFASPKLRRLSYVGTLPGHLYSYFLSVPFLVGSLLLLPLDTLMIALGYKKTWLD